MAEVESGCYEEYEDDYKDGMKMAMKMVMTMARKKARKMAMENSGGGMMGVGRVYGK